MPHVTIRIAGEFGADRDKACASEVSSRVFRSSSVPHVQPRLCIARRDIHKWHAHARAALHPPWTIRSRCNSGEFAQLYRDIYLCRPVSRSLRARWPICSYITGSNTGPAETTLSLSLSLSPEHAAHAEREARGREVASGSGIGIAGALMQIRQAPPRPRGKEAAHGFINESNGDTEKMLARSRR
jgi:hypothetical protein